MSPKGLKNAVAARMRVMMVNGSIGTVNDCRRDQMKIPPVQRAGWDYRFKKSSSRMMFPLLAVTVKIPDHKQSECRKKDNEGNQKPSHDLSFPSS